MSTSDQSKSKEKVQGFYRIGGILIFVSSFLLLIKAIAEYILGPPPSTGSSIINWVNNNSLLFIIINESFFIAVFLFIPSFIIIYYKLEKYDKVGAIIGVTIMLLVVPIISMLTIIQGRLIYPVFNITITNTGLAEFIVAFYYGGIHTSYLMIGVSVLVLTLSMKKATFGQIHVYFGIITGLVLFLVMGFEWLFPIILVFVSQLFFIIWFFMIGIRLYRST